MDNKELDNIELEEENIETPEDDTTPEIDYSGEFHERDSFIDNNIVSEVKDSFRDYAASVIMARAIPDLRDGLKPVHRRILWSMYENGYTPDKPHKKCATTVGNVIGAYHPHGDTSVYDAMVRLAQYWNERYMLIDGHGNFGNIDGDDAAAYRYTESRLSKISLELLRDINKDTVDMHTNFDETRKEPYVLPSKFPNILVNGTMGIAVGMATNIPPHNLGEVIDGCIAYIDNPDIDTNGLMQYIKGPDFPTGGIILGNSGIKKAYETGRGTIIIRSKAVIEESGSHNNIVITEVPYGVNTNDLKERVAELVHNKVIDGISDYHTELKNGVKITITLKKDANAQVILNKLYKMTNFQVSYGIIFLMIDDKTPKILGLKDIISKYIDHQKEVIIRRTRFDLRAAEKEAHIYEGLKIALDNIDSVIKLIRGSKTDEEAKNGLITQFGLDEVQSQAILEMKLRRLTGLAREDVLKHLDELHKTIEELQSILASTEKVLKIIKDEMTEIKRKYADDRRTTIDMTAIDFIEDESLIPVEDIIVNITKNGYIKRVPIDTYKVQNKGGVGVKGMTTNEEDIVESIISLQTHDHVLFFTNKGKVYRIKGYEIPEFSRQSKGLPVVNLLPIEKDERVMSILPIRVDENIGEKKITFVTKQGLVKRTDISEFENIRKTGKIAIGLKENDEILTVMLTSGNDDILICANNGRMIRFNESEIRVLGRSASGVKGIEIPDDAKCVSAVVVKPEDEILIVTENGYGKRTNAEEYRLTHRGSKGVKAMNITEKNGPIISVSKVEDDSDLIIITNNGMIIRIPLEQVSKMSRVTQGIRVITLKDGQKVSSTSVSKKEDEKPSEEVVTESVTEETPIEE
jgi:DNA gyrase subunit A